MPSAAEAERPADLKLVGLLQLIPAALFLSLGFVRNRLYHSLLVPFILALMLLQVSQLRVG